MAFLYDQNTKQDNKNTTTELMLSERVNGAYRNDWSNSSERSGFPIRQSACKLRPENNQNPHTFPRCADQYHDALEDDAFHHHHNQSRRGYTPDSSMNRNELIWNAQLSQSF